MSSKLIEYGLMGFALFTFLNNKKDAPASGKSYGGLGGSSAPGMSYPSPDFLTPGYAGPRGGTGSGASKTANQIGQWADVIGGIATTAGQVWQAWNPPKTAAPKPAAKTAAGSSSGGFFDTIGSWFR